MRPCEDCGAANPERATFCGQCHRPFHAVHRVEGGARPVVPPTDPASPAPDSVAPDPVAPTAGGTGAASPDETRSGRSGRFRVEQGAVAWTCGVCDAENDLDVFTCTVCGSRMDTEVPPAGPAVSRTTLRRLEMLVPGVGHMRGGAVGMGIARIGMVVVWAIGAMVLASGGAAGLRSSVPLLLGIAGIWATGPGDLSAHLDGRPPRLDAGRFMYLVLGVTVAVILVGGLSAVL